MRTGIGYDVHRFDPDRPLILAGVHIPDSPGLHGHSDADVISHAIADAILGAAALGDIGTHFPDTDPQWQGADSLEMLQRVRELVDEVGYVVINVDATLILERPKIAAYSAEMRANLALALQIGPGDVSIKATTVEGLGPFGRGEGAACMATALLVSRGSH